MAKYFLLYTIDITYLSDIKSIELLLSNLFRSHSLNVKRP